MIRDLQLNEAGTDVELVGGALVLVGGADRVAQNLQQRFELVQGEWWLDINAGVPYFSDIFGVNTTKQNIDAIFRQVILSTLDVRSILDFESDLDREERQYTLTATVDTLFGPVDFIPAPLEF